MIAKEIIDAFAQRMRNLSVEAMALESSVPLPHDELVAKIKDIRMVQQEIQSVCKKASTEERFALINITSLLDAIAARLLTTLDSFAEEKPNEESAFNLSDFIVTTASNTREIETEVGRSFYVNSRAELTHSGSCLIADYYNQKYFQESKEHGSRKIVITSSKDDLQKKMLSALKSSEENIRIGFTVTRNPYLFVGKTPHPSPVILERVNGQVYLYIADSIGINQPIADMLSQWCHEQGITPILSSIARQTDNGSCRSEALVYLKNALQLPGSIADHVRITELREGMCSFIDSADMLKTTQTSKAVAAGIPDPSSATLYSTKAKKSFDEKLASYSRDVLYLRADLLHPEGYAILAHPELPVFKERTYLQQKTQRHLQIIENILRSPGMTQGGIEAIKRRALELPEHLMSVEVPDAGASVASNDEQFQLEFKNTSQVTEERSSYNDGQGQQNKDQSPAIEIHAFIVESLCNQFLLIDDNNSIPPMSIHCKVNCDEPNMVFLHQRFEVSAVGKSLRELDKLQYLLKTLGALNVKKETAPGGVAYLAIPDTEIVKLFPSSHLNNTREYYGGDGVSARTQLKKIKILCAQYLGHTWEASQDTSAPDLKNELNKKEEVVRQLYHAESTVEARTILFDNQVLLNKNRTPWSILILKTMAVILTLPISLPALLIYSKITRGSCNFFKPDSQILSDKLFMELTHEPDYNDWGVR